MKRTLLATLAGFFLLLPPCFAGGTDPLPASPPQEESLDADPVVKGVKELLTVASDRAAKAAAKTDGYFGNKAIRIGMPDELEHLPPYLQDRGFQSQVDAFALSLNRAAEKAAPKAATLFAAAIRETAFDDARKILNGGDTAATDYFRKKAAEQLYKAYTPAMAASMKEAGVSSAWRAMMDRYDGESVAPFPVGDWGFDLEGYMTGKALDGLFLMMGEEEKKIRKEPTARSTELLRKIFGKAE